MYSIPQYYNFSVFTIDKNIGKIAIKDNEMQNIAIIQLTFTFSNFVTRIAPFMNIEKKKIL